MKKILFLVFIIGIAYTADTCSQNCVCPQNSVTCSSCVDGKYEKANSCNANCSDVTSNCIACSDSGRECTKCKPDYMLLKLKLQDRSRVLAVYPTKRCLHYPNCIKLNDSEKCIECKDGYFVGKKDGANKNKCISMPNCTASNSEDSCTSCKEGYKLKQSTCNAIPIENCKTQQESKCTECKEGFVSISENKKCIAKIVNCTKQTEQGCTACEKGTQLSQNKDKCKKPVENNNSSNSSSLVYSIGLCCLTIIMVLN